MDPTDPADEPPRRSSFEDFEIPVPSSPPPPLRRPAVLTTAAVVLLVAAMMNALFLALFRPSGGVALFIVVAAAQGIAAVLILLRQRFGYPAGIVMGAVGIVMGIVRAPSDALSALMTIALSGFVIWAVASNGASFRRG